MREFELIISAVEDEKTGLRRLKVAIESDFEKADLHKYFGQFDSEKEISDPKKKAALAKAVLDFLMRSSETSASLIEEKAKKYDDLKAAIWDLYEDESFMDEGDGLISVGEIAACHFGFMQ